jgi:cytochrome c-type biogenesis protein CcmH/NrfG
VIGSPYLDWDTELAGEVVDSNHYGFHVGAITSFGLHAKSKFAAELAYRDMQIEQKDRRIAELEADKAELQKESDEHYNNYWDIKRKFEQLQDQHPAKQESKLLTDTHFPDLDDNLAKLSITL